MDDKAELTNYPALWSDLGTVDYERSFRLQGRLAGRVATGGAGFALFLEHPPTITLGWSLKGDEGRSAIRSSPAELESAGIKVVEVDRGGKATFHGPGQLVCYLILSLKHLRLGIKRYVGKMESVVLGSLAELGIEAALDPEYPGVWAGGAKLAAVGVRVTDRVTTHGFALNVAPDLASFEHIVPCGIKDKPVTSIEALGVEPPGRNKLIEVLVRHLGAEMRMEMKRAEPERIWSELNGGAE